MRKVFKPENVVKKEKTVKIPDVEFINDTTAQADADLKPLMSEMLLYIMQGWKHRRF